MAKITAYGATEVARIRTRDPAGHEHLWVINSRGIVLRRPTGIPGTSYTVYRRLAARLATRDKLAVVAELAGHAII